MVVRNIEDQKRIYRLTMHRRLWLPSVMHRWFARRAKKQAKHAQSCFDNMRFNAMHLEDIALQVEQPCLLIWGEKDRILHVDGLDILGALLANNNKVLLEKTGHLPMLERPQLCASHYRNFLRNQHF